MFPPGSSAGGPGSSWSPLPDVKLVSSALDGPQVDTSRHSDRPRLSGEVWGDPSLGMLPEARVTLMGSESLIESSLRQPVAGTVSQNVVGCHLSKWSGGVTLRAMLECGSVRT